MSSILEDPATQGRGMVLSAQGTPLQRLNYFDGKFLRADHLREEQDYFRALVGLANRASGVGIVYGLDVERGGGDTLVVRPGLATDASGRPLLLQSSEQVSLGELILASQGAAASSTDWGAPGAAAAPFSECADKGVADEGDALDDLYVVTAHPADRLCGTEDVYGLLCEQACYTDTQHPYIRSGVLLRATPLRLDATLASSTAVDLEDDRYWRSRVASAFYADERGDPASLISGAGLAGSVWCRGAAARVGEGVPLAVVGRRGSANIFLDLWTVRRERMEGSPRRYWASRMAMRPWDVFLAQVLQFQCQLSSVDLGEAGPGEMGCRDEIQSASALMAEMQNEVERLVGIHVEGGGDTGDGERATRRALGMEAGNRNDLVAEMSALMSRKMGKIRGNLGAWLAKVPSRRRILLDAGFVELPPAGYLPVAPGDVPVETQLRDLMGEGVDLRFCVVRPDFVPHALEEAQHMDRISLVQGLEDPRSKPRVDILVPRGRSVADGAPRTGQGYDMTLALARDWVLRLLMASAKAARGMEKKRMVTPPIAYRTAGSIAFQGAARSHRLPGGGAAFHFSAITGAGDGDEIFARCAKESSVGKVDTLGMDGVYMRAMSRRMSALEHPEFMVLEEEPVLEEVPVEEIPEKEPLPEALRGALWTSLRSDLDPFDLAAGEATAMRAELDLLLLSGGETLRSLAVFDGQYVVEMPVGGGNEVRGRLQGTLTVVGDDVETITGSLGLRRTGDSGRTSMDFILDPYSGIGARGHRVWTGPDTALACGGLERAGLREWATPAAEEAAEISMEDVGDLSNRETEKGERATPAGEDGWEAAVRAMSMMTQPTKTTRVDPFFAADQRRDQDALQPGSPSYADALDGLDLYRTRVDAGLADARQRLLLPDQAGDGGSRTLAREDWVLFHRRRDKNCGAGPAEVRQVRERYRVYRSGLSVKELSALLRKVVGGDESVLGKIPWTSVGTVSFAPGERTPQNGAGDLLRNWTFQGLSGARLALVALAGEDYGVTGGEALAKDRLLKTLGRLASVAVTTATRVQVLPGGLPNPSAGGMEGVLLLLTVEGRGIPEDDTAIRVVVKTRRGEPVGGAEVVLHGCGPQSLVGTGEGAKCTSARKLRTVESDAGGTALLTGLEPGFYQISVDPASAGFGGVKDGGLVVFELEAGGVADLGFTLLP